jgi:putative FmdB family regulatory protein
MPLYEYKCQRCGKIFEVRQKFSDEPLFIHEDCGGELEKLLSAPALQFKGTGWYVTDYAHGSQSNSNGKTENKSESKTESKSESKSEGKTESKSESKSSSSPSSDK